MKHLKKVLALLCVFALLLGIVPAVSAADLGEFTILSTTDMHGRCWDTNILNDTAATNTLLQAATAVKGIRAAKENVILLDNGDTYQGTPVSTYQLSLQKQGLIDLPNPMALAMKEMAYDAATVGNHEFNYDWETMDAVRAYLADATQGNAVASLCANLYYDGTDGVHTAGENVCIPYMIKEITAGEETYKIAIIGFENTDCPRWDVPDNYPGMVFTHPDNTTGAMAWEAQRYLEQVQEYDPDFIIVAYHSGLGDGAAPEDIVFGKNSENQILSMIKNTEGIDMVIAGHDHSSGYSGSTYKDQGGNDVIVVNGAGNNLTCTTFGIDASGSIYLKKHEDLPLKNYAADTALKEQIKPYAELASKYVNQVCGTILPGTWSKSTNFYLQQTDTMDFVNRAQIAQGTIHLAEKYDTEEKVAALFDATGLDHLSVDVSSSSVVVSGNYTVQPGTMSMKDIYRLYKYDNTLYLVPLTGAQIKEIMEFNASERLAVSTASGTPVYSCIGDSFTNPVFYGLDFKYDMAQEKGSRVVDLKFADGRAFEMDKTYIMAINNYHLGNGPFAAYSTDDAIWSQTDDLGGGVVQDLIAAFLKAETEAKGGVSPAPSKWELTYTGEIESGVATGDYILNQVTSAEDLYEGGMAAIYHIAGTQTLSSNASDNKLAPCTDVTLGEGKLGTSDWSSLFEIRFPEENENGYFYLYSWNDGGYVTSGATGNSLGITEDYNEYSLWELIPTDNEGQFYIRNVNAAHNGNKNQHLEVYNGVFTTYGLNSGGDAYLMSMYIEPKVEGEFVLTEAASAADLYEGCNVVIYHPASEQVLTNIASGSRMAPASDFTIGWTELGTDNASAVFTYTATEEGYFMLTDAEGRYLTSGATGNSLSMTEEANDYSLWEIEWLENEGEVYIRNVNASYNNGPKDQYLEYYNNKFTTYGLKSGGAAYVMRLYSAPKGGSQPCLHENYELLGARDPACTENGYTGDFVCTDCGALLSEGEVIPATGHSGGTATCHTLATCDVCGEEHGEYDPDNHEGDTELHNYRAPTCHEDGFSGDLWCTGCGEYISFGEGIPANSENCPSKQFTDLTSEWYHEGVDFVIREGIMKGTSDTHFQPRANMTRAQMAMVLYRMAGEPSVEGLENPFTDVKETSWYADAVLWAYDQGITTGATATTFDPQGLITRQQFVTMLYRAEDPDAIEEDHLAGFEDKDTISSWAVDAMNWAVAKGIIEGMTETKLAPKASAQRAQIALMIYRFAENVVNA